MTGAEVIQIVDITSRLVGPLGTLIGALIDAGHSPEEAEKIVEKNITSLKDRYEREKAEDERLLAEKHGLPVNPYESEFVEPDEPEHD